jgi:hypothetical protein
MALDLAGYEARARDAVRAFWAGLGRGAAGDASPHFPALPEFQGASYQQRYHLLCQRLVRERLYTAACAPTSPRTAAADGQYADLGDVTGLRTFVAALAGHVAAEAARG